jgi:hypothetical protein
MTFSFFTSGDTISYAPDIFKYMWVLIFYYMQSNHWKKCGHRVQLVEVQNPDVLRNEKEIVKIRGVCKK